MLSMSPARFTFPCVARIAAALTLLYMPPNVEAATLNVPADFPTIGAALAASVVGDSVVIACGTYSESSLPLPSGITVCSETGDPSCVTIDAQDQSGFIGDFLVGSTSMDGITIQNAKAGGGAGLWCIADCTLSVSNCIFSDCQATSGAGVGIAFGCVEFLNCTFRNNQANAGQYKRGGGVHVNASRARFEMCLFLQNGATRGGAIYAFNGAEVELRDCRFLENTANGGGAVCLEEGARLAVQGSWFETNEALDSPTSTGSGGAMLARLGTTVQIESSTFLRNSAGVGGALASLGASSIVLIGSSIIGNRAEAAGGFLISGGPFSIERALFWDNEASIANAGAVQLVGAPGTIASSTFHANAAAVSGGAIHAAGSKGSIQIRSCILTQNSASEPVSCGDDSIVSAQCCDVFGNGGGDWIGCLTGLEGNDGNFSSDPLYCDSQAGNFELRTDSPCAEHPSCGLIGAFPVGCGAVSVTPASWGSIKALYR